MDVPWKRFRRTVQVLQNAAWKRTLQAAIPTVWRRSPGFSRLKPGLQRQTVPLRRSHPLVSSAMKISYLMYDPVPRLSDLDRIMAGVAALGYHGIELVATHPL